MSCTSPSALYRLMPEGVFTQNESSASILSQRVGAARQGDVGKRDDRRLEGFPPARTIDMPAAVLIQTRQNG